MARPVSPVDERKDAILSVRMTDAEYAGVVAAAAAAREDLGEYVRHRLIDAPKSPRALDLEAAVQAVSVWGAQAFES